MNSRRELAGLIDKAKGRWNPIKTFCLFSGGGDSGVLAHLCRDHYDALLYIDTGTAIPTTREPAIQGVEDHVRSFAADLGKPLVVRSSGDAFRTMVLGDRRWWQRYRRAAAESGAPLSIEQMIAADKSAGRTSSKRYGYPPHGFPGPGQHGIAYSRLKGRRIEEILRETKRGYPRRAAVLFLSGVRRSESKRRANLDPFSERRSAKFCSPLIDWTAAQLADYRAKHDLPTSDVSALLHRSGECNCGAFAQAAEERALMRAFWPGWWASHIEALEVEAEARGIRWCRWCGFDVDGNRASGRSIEKVGPLCVSCPTRSFQTGGALPATPEGARRATHVATHRATGGPRQNAGIARPGCNSADQKTLKSPRQSRVRL
jgi:3'-phosphoadenosine 5'-phosphosulfate sulfotransferase (PAPS reductase)/FAD synthetase